MAEERSDSFQELIRQIRSAEREWGFLDEDESSGDAHDDERQEEALQGGVVEFGLLTTDDGAESKREPTVEANQESGVDDREVGEGSEEEPAQVSSDRPEQEENEEDSPDRQLKNYDRLSIGRRTRKK